jgi:hypothetical protein
MADTRDMTTDPGALARLDGALKPNGLFVRGGFHPQPADGVPALPDGGAAQTVVLIGNAGMDMWRAFRAARPVPDGRNPLEAWLDPLIEDAARAVGAAQVIFPTRKPFPPVQRWAQRAEPVHPSPIGLLIHPRYGLFHVYRAVLLFRERLALPAFDMMASPCERCADKPCLATCPADALGPGRFDTVGCVDHVTGNSGGNCRERGCLARRACPVGREFQYAPEAGAFHMAAVVRAVRGMQRRTDGGGADMHGEFA